ncbi:hypothetical protein Tco_0005242 [Tanacetum coccineum]
MCHHHSSSSARLFSVSGDILLIPSLLIRNSRLSHPNALECWTLLQHKAIALLSSQCRASVLDKAAYWQMYFFLYLGNQHDQRLQKLLVEYRNPSSTIDPC